MKKFGRAAILVCSLCLALTACSDDGAQTGNEDVTAAEVVSGLAVSEGKEIFTADPKDSISLLQDARPSDYVTLNGDYRKIDVSAVDLAVSEEEVQKQVENLLMSHRAMEKIEDRGAQTGDILELNLKGTVQDQVIIDEKDVTVILGSSGIAPEFDQKLEGANAGDLVTLDVKYGEDCEEEQLRGKTVHFEVKLHTIYLPVVPDYTDDFVAANTACDSIVKYEKALKKKLQDTKKKDAVALWMTEHSSVKEIPQSILERYQKRLIQRYTMTAEKEYGISFEELLKKLNYQTQYELLEDNRESLTAAIQSDLAYAVVADEQKLSATVKDYIAYLEEYAKDCGMKDAEELLEYYSESEMRQYYLEELVASWILEHSGIH